MTSAMRCTLLAACAALATAGQAATPFDTPGPFVQYNINSNGLTYVGGTDWVHVAAGSFVADGQGGIGVAKVALQRIGGGDSGGIWSGWNDSLTFTSVSAPAGTLGTVSVLLNYSWSAQVSGTSLGAAYVDISLRRNGTGTGLSSQYAQVSEDITRSCGVAGQCGGLSVSTSPSTVPTPTFANGVATFQLNVVFGQSYRMVVGMNAEVYGGMNGGAGAITVDATHSLYWGGITSVMAGSTSVPYQVTALSGVNYANPVPEAPTWELSGAGMLAICCALRRRRQGFVAAG